MPQPSSLPERRCTSGVWRIIPSASGFLFLPFFRHTWPICQAILRIHGGRWGECVFFLPFIFFFPSLLRVRCRVHSKRTSRIDRAECLRVCARARARIFCVERARKHTENESLLSSNYRDEGARKKGGPTCRRPDEPDDYINQTTTIPDVGFRDRDVDGRGGERGWEGGVSFAYSFIRN